MPPSLPGGRLSHDLSRLAAALGGRYRVESEVGRGGMATVYRAVDEKHRRTVAIKVLAEELAASVGTERFLEEIRITAGLTHPHILPLLDSGATDGILYFVMPFIDGETLRKRMEREGPLPIQDAVRVARELASALAHAHERGVVHRDIKPENILLAGGHAVVADFGIARALSKSGGERLTETGLAVGTPHYMSPEQATGEGALDGRADIFAAGCVLYEMLTGEIPHSGPSAQAILTRRVTEPARPVQHVREAVPDDLAATVSRALQRLPADRFATAGEFHDALSTALDTPEARTPASPATPISLALLRRAAYRRTLFGFLIAAVGGGLWLLGPWGGTETPDGRPSLVVLPFQNVGEADREYFADGITEELTSRLAQISGLRVTSRSTALRYKGTDRTLRQIGEELSVSFVLEGTVRTDRTPDGGGQVRVTPQLIRVDDDSHLWTDRYTAELVPGDVFRVQAEIAERVAGALDVTLLEGERRAVEAVPTASARAHDAYLLGRFHWNKRTPEDLRRAEAHFLQAVEEDPQYAEAFAGLAQTYTVFPFVGVPDPPAPQVFQVAAGFAERALQLNRIQPDAWAALALARMYGDWDWAGAEAAFREALGMDPLNPTTRYWHAELLATLDRLPEAEAEARRGLALEPTAPIAHAILATVLLMQERWDEAEERYRQALALEPAQRLPNLGLGTVAMVTGRYEQAHNSLLRAGFAEAPLRVVVDAMTAGSDRARAADEVDSQFRREPTGDLVQPAFLFAVLGDTARAMDWLEEAAEVRYAPLPTLIRLPWARSMAESPRFQALLEAMGLEG